MSRLLILLSLFFLTLSSCQSSYEKEISKWQAERLAELKEPFGWPSVVGLFWLRNTISYYGSESTNDFMIKNAPSSFGHMLKTDTGMVIKSFRNKRVLVDGEPIQIAPLRSDQHEDGPSICSFENLQWYILERGDRYYLRVKDTLSPYRTALKDIPYFPIDERYRVEAKVMDADDLPLSLSYKNVLDQEISNPVAAYLTFDWEGQRQVIAAFENDDETYHVMIYDQTSGDSSYGGGRYLYPKLADSSGVVILDFNKLENPPCVFTPHATCPFPPDMNRLPFDIRAGEMTMHLYN